MPAPTTYSCPSRWEAKRPIPAAAFLVGVFSPTPLKTIRESILLNLPQVFFEHKKYLRCHQRVFFHDWSLRTPPAKKKKTEIEVYFQPAFFRETNGKISRLKMAGYFWEGYVGGGAGWLAIFFSKWRGWVDFFIQFSGKKNTPEKQRLSNPFKLKLFFPLTNSSDFQVNQPFVVGGDRFEKPYQQFYVVINHQSLESWRSWFAHVTLNTTNSLRINC